MTDISCGKFFLYPKIQLIHGTLLYLELMKKYRAGTLKWHNILRVAHEAPPLELDDELSKQAQAWADGLARRKTLQHSSVSGENLIQACSPDGEVKRLDASKETTMIMAENHHHRLVVP